ncbi:MAG: hypothetical protein HRU20_10705 [Pseudomonadales bacterium]|nr:hypothetical protein [Pseudomonadales bacterium]
MKYRAMGLLLSVLLSACLPEDDSVAAENEQEPANQYRSDGYADTGATDLSRNSRIRATRPVSTQSLADNQTGTVYAFTGLAYVPEDDAYYQGSISKNVLAAEQSWQSLLRVVVTDIEFNYIAQPRINRAYYADSGRPFITEDCVFITEGDPLPEMANIGDAGDDMAFSCEGLEVMHSWAFLESEANSSALIFREKIIRIIDSDATAHLSQEYVIDTYLAENGHIHGVKVSYILDGDLKYVFRSFGL